MKIKLCLLLTVLVACIGARAAELAERFGIYLTVHQEDAISSDRTPIDLAKVKIEKTPLFTGEDIVDLLPGTITLTPVALMRLPRPSNRGTTFVVMADGNRIFLGAFWTIHSSLGPAVPTISVDAPRPFDAPDPDHSLRLSSCGRTSWSDPRIQAVVAGLKAKKKALHAQPAARGNAE